MAKEFLPQTQNNVMFSPQAVKEVFAKAVIEENGNIENIFTNKRKYKQLLEMWQASFLSVGIYKWTGKKFFLIPSDSPDVYLIHKDRNGEQQGFPVEIMELYNHKEQQFNDDYGKLAKHIWNSKGTKDYGNCELLLVSRFNYSNFNVKKFAEELAKYKWFYKRVWFSIFTRSENIWTIFEIIPYVPGTEIKYLQIDLNDQPF